MKDIEHAERLIEQLLVTIAQHRQLVELLQRTPVATPLTR